MKNTLKEISQTHGGHFIERNFRWWNGHAYMDGTEYKVGFEINGCSISLLYERLNSEFEKVGVLGGTHSSRNKCNIHMDTKRKTEDFEVRKTPWLKRLFNKNAIQFEVKCKSIKFKERLINTQELEAIYKKVYDSPEFEPEIKGSYENGNFQMKVLYQTQSNNPAIMKTVIDFVSYIAELENY